MKLQFKNSNSYNIGLIIISAVISNLSYPELNLFWVQFFSLVPFFYVVLDKKISENAILYFPLWGVTFYGIMLFWLRIFHPLALPGILIGIYFYFSVFGFVLSYLLHYFPKLKFFLIPGVWVTMEYIRSSGFLGFPWGLTAHSQWNFLPFIQIADVFGIWIISFLVVFINVLLLEIYLNLKQKRLVLHYLIVLFLCFFLPISYGLQKISHYKNSIKTMDKIKIALIQNDINPNLAWDKIQYDVLSKLTYLSERANLENPDLISWSETSILNFIKYFSDNETKFKKNPQIIEQLQYARNVLRLGKDLNTYIFTGIPHYEKVLENNKIKEANYNSAILITPEGNISDIYYKIHLVPFGEWFPYKISFINKILTETWAGDWTPGYRYTVFKIIKNNKEYSFSCLICFEGIFGDLCRHFILNGAEFLLNITNDTWSFTKSAELQHMIADIFRSIENRVPYVRCGNSGATAFINQYGEITSLLPLFTSDFLVDQIAVKPIKNFTIYTKYGDFFAKFLLIFNLLLIVYIMIFQILLRKEFKK